MQTAHDLKLQIRIDDFSYQVAAENDALFWFRLERKADRDVITDFSLGSLPVGSAAGALVSCYEHLGLCPQSTIVFRDILASGGARRGEAAPRRPLDDVLDEYVGWGKALLSNFGSAEIDERLERRRDKLDLVLHIAAPMSA